MGLIGFWFYKKHLLPVVYSADQKGPLQAWCMFCFSRKQKLYQALRSSAALKAEKAAQACKYKRKKKEEEEEEEEEEARQHNGQ